MIINRKYLKLCPTKGVAGSNLITAMLSDNVLHLERKAEATQCHTGSAQLCLGAAACWMVERKLCVTSEWPHKSQRFFTRSPFERGKKNKNTKKTKKTKPGLISRNKVNRSIFNIRYSLRNYSSHVDWFSKQHQAWICSSNLLVEKKYINAFVTVDPKLDF